MPERHWLQRAALGCLIVVWLPSGLLAQENDQLPSERHRPPVEEPQARPQTDPPKRQENSQAEKRKSPKEALPQTSARIGEVMDAYDTDIHTNPSDQYSYSDEDKIARRDLAAQESMANSAWFQVVIGFIAIVLLAWTLYYTRRAVNEAAKGSAAALKAVEVTRTLGIQQLRAYVNATDIRVHMFYPNQRAIFSIKVTNSGNTPAYNVRVFTTLTLTNNPNTSVAFRRGLPESSAIVAGGGGMVGHDSPMDIPADLHDLITKGEVTIVLAGYIRYRDVFRKRHGSTFKAYLRFVDITDGHGAMTATKRNNYAN